MTEIFRLFARILFSRNFAYAKFRENKTLVKISEFTVHVLTRQLSSFNFSKYFDALNCMSEQLPDCKEESWYGIYNYYVMKLKNSHRWAECLYRERAWNCGSNGVATLFQVLNMFASEDTICMYVSLFS